MPCVLQGIPETIANLAKADIKIWVLIGIKIMFSYSSTKTYVVGVQKNRLNEAVLLSTQNTCFKLWIRK